MSNLAQSKPSLFVRKAPAAAASPTTPGGPTQPAPAPVLNIAGTKTSLQNSQLLTPVGIPSLDFFLGGGLPVGSICLIGQDAHNSFADIVTRCYLAEGIVHKHALYVADLTESREHLFKRIPNVVNKLESETKSASDDKQDEKLRIAWRYGQQPPGAVKPPTEDPAVANKILQPNYFVMNNLMSADEVSQASSIASFEPPVDCSCPGENAFGNAIYSKLAADVAAQTDALNMNITKTKQYTNIMRIAINSLGGLVWNDKCSLDDTKKQTVALCRLLLFLRQLLRHSLAVCVVTVPNELTRNPCLIEKLIHLSDYAFTLDDSSSSISRLANTQYNGLFRLLKLPRLNSMSACYTPETLDLAFYVKRKRLIVEQLHLPPDIGENDDKQKGRTTTSVASIACASGPSGSKLDF